MIKDRPNIYTHHDYRVFLKAWFDYRASNEKKFSMRVLALKSELSCAYLPQVLSGKRKLSVKALAKLTPFLGLTKPEIEFLELLRVFSDAKNQAAKSDALKKLQSSKTYRQLNPNEAEAYRYLSHWYYVAIKEMTVLSDFRPDPKWIAEKMGNRITAKEAHGALEFLISHGYLKKSEEGKLIATQKNIDCVGGVYSLALNHFHQEVIGEGLKELQKPQTQDKYVLGYTLSYTKKNMDQIAKILEEATDKIAQLEKKNTKPDGVYHVSLLAFPITGPYYKGRTKGASDV